MNSVITIGVISDTHGLLREEAVEALRESDLILHAGDVGAPEILARLRELAPVTAIRGNVDTQKWARSLPETEVIEAGDVTIYMIHNVDAMDLRPETAGFQVVVYGHSHQPKMDTRKGVLYFNPGSAGPRRFKLPVCVGKLVLKNGKVRGELVELSV